MTKDELCERINEVSLYRAFAYNQRGNAMHHVTPEDADPLFRNGNPDLAGLYAKNAAGWAWKYLKERDQLIADVEDWRGETAVAIAEAVARSIGEE